MTGWRDTCARRRNRSGKQLTTKFTGFCLRLHAQVPFQRVEADLVLPERRRPPTLPQIETHQSPVDGLVERVESEQPPGSLDRGLGRAGLRLVR